MVRLTHVATPIAVFGMLALAACPGDDVPIDTDGASSSDSTGDLTTTMTPTTTMPTTTIDPDSGTDTVADTSSSDGGPMCEPACPDGECCVGGACFDAPQPSCNPGCADTESCRCPEGSDPCDCVAECLTCGIEEDSYDPCLEAECPAGTVCVVDDPMDPTFAVCAAQGCGEDACVCPLPPDSGTAVNNCGELPGDEGGGSCYLDCAEGTCPDDMICRPLGDLDVCVWPGEGVVSDCCAANGTPGCDDMACQDTICGMDPFCCDSEWDMICADAAVQACVGLCPGALPPLGPWGDCVNMENPCELGSQCLTADLPPLFGWCATVPCVDDMDCRAAPATGDAPAVCAPILDGGMTSACILDCAMGQTCPDGMICGLDSFCGWAQFQPGYGNCGLPEVGCQPDEACLDDADAMMMTPATWSVCSQDTCAGVADCTALVPAGGVAPVACGDLGTGADTCYLDCSADAMSCPDGMSCTNNTHCTWPQGPTLFSDNFESGDFASAFVANPVLDMMMMPLTDWTLNNVDGNTPNAGTNFVTDAWVASDAGDGMGVNFAATSTSWYEPIGMSDDWLVTPPLALGMANHRVYWVSRSTDPGFPDDLEILISTATNDPADFTTSLVTFAPEDTNYTSHFVELDMATYGGMQVYLAWRNITNDGNLLLVDNVAVVQLP